MGVDSATCDHCEEREGTVEDLDHQWWCAECWWTEGDYNDDSLQNLNRLLEEAANQVTAATIEMRKIQGRIKSTKRKLKKIVEDAKVTKEE